MVGNSSTHWWSWFSIHKGTTLIGELVLIESYIQERDLSSANFVKKDLVEVAHCLTMSNLFIEVNDKKIGK